jgi:hypothetical protein
MYFEPVRLKKIESTNCITKICKQKLGPDRLSQFSLHFQKALFYPLKPPFQKIQQKGIKKSWRITSLF